MEAEARQVPARQIIDTIKYLTLATVSKNGEPWNAPVFFAHDAYTSFYWGSRRKEAQHSHNIRANGKGYIVIYDSTIIPGNGRAVYIQAKCEELDSLEEIKFAIGLLHERFGESYMTPEDVQGTSPLRLYKATLERAWIKNETIDVREEVSGL